MGRIPTFSPVDELWACWLLGGMSRSHLPLEVPIGKLSRIAEHYLPSSGEWFGGVCEHFRTWSGQSFSEALDAPLPGGAQRAAPDIDRAQQWSIMCWLCFLVWFVDAGKRQLVCVSAGWICTIFRSLGELQTCQSDGGYSEAAPPLDPPIGNCVALRVAV